MPRSPDGSAPFVVTLGFDAETFERLQALRDRYYPPERNLVPAHLSLFHRLPPEQFGAIGRSLEAAAGASGPIALEFPAVRSLGSGLALAVKAPGLKAIRSRLADDFRPWLTPQDRQPFRPHVTILNKATRAATKIALDQLRAAFEPWRGIGDSLRLWSYLGGPWEPVARYPFRGDTPAG